MPPQMPIEAFKPEVREAFEHYLTTSHKAGKLLMNASRRALYLRFLSDPDQKIVETDKHEKSRLYTEKRRAINEFCVDNRGQLLHVGLKKGDITRPQAFVYDAFDIIARVHAAGGHNGYKKTYQRVKNEAYGISRDDVQWLLEHCQVCMVNRQNITRAPLQPIVALNVHERVQADLIDMRTKPDGSFVWILHIKDHFSKHSMLYALTSKKSSEIAYYISLYVRHFGAPEIFQCDNGREFKGALLIFLKKHGIKLINGRPRTPRTQGLVEQANAVVKNKITRWQAEHGTGAWAESLTEICEAINSQTHESLPARVTPFQLMFSRNPSLRNTEKTGINHDQRAFLAQISVNNIDKICSDEPLQRGATISEELETTIEVALDMIPDEEVNNPSDSDPENPLEFGYVFLFFI